MNRTLHAAAILISIVGATIIWTLSSTGIRASQYDLSRVVRFEGGEWNAPDSASEFCKAVYEGTKGVVGILMTVPTGTEIEGTPITEHYTMIATGELIPVKTCFDGDPRNDPEGEVLALDVAELFLAERADSNVTTLPGGEVKCTWNGLTIEENLPGWWQDEQSKYESLLLSLINANEPGISLEEASTRNWAPRAHMGQDVTSMPLPTWMRNLIIPQECELVQGTVPGRLAAFVDGLQQHLAEHIAIHAEDLQRWIDRDAPGLTLDEAARRFGGGERDENGDTLPAPWGICAPNWWIPEALQAAGLQLPTWISIRIVGYQESPGYPECPDESELDANPPSPEPSADLPSPEQSAVVDQINLVVECPEDLNELLCTAFEYSMTTGELLRTYPVDRP